MTKTKPQKIIVVVCGSKPGVPMGHCSICFGEEMAAKERKQMEKCGYPIKGVFEVSTVNVFHREPFYLSGTEKGDSKVNIYL